MSAQNEAKILLETKHLKKYFNTPRGMLHAVDDVDLTIRSGQTLGVVGESGCGKSTLGRTVLRLLEPTSGEILFDGSDVAKMNRAQIKQFRNRAQIIFQDPYASLNPRMTVYEIIAEPLIAGHLRKSSAELEKDVFQMMDTVGLGGAAGQRLSARAGRRPPPAHRHRPRAGASSRSSSSATSRSRRWTCRFRRRS